MTFSPLPDAAARAERRAALAESLSEIGSVLERLDAALEQASSAGPADPEGHLHAAVRAMLLTAGKIPGFDVTVLAGPHGDWAVRVQSGPDGLTAELGRRRAEPAEDGVPEGGDPGSVASAGVVAQLADLLRRDGGSTR